MANATDGNVEVDFDNWLAANANHPDVLDLNERKQFTDFETWLAEATDTEELVALRNLAEEAEGYAPDWRHGATLIRESYFEEYCQELCEDIGDLPKNMPSYIVIDWDATSHNLKADYTEVNFDGITYLVR